MANKATEPVKCKEICAVCENVYFAGPKSLVCPRCRKKIFLDNAKKIKLSQTGLDARKGKQNNV